MQDRFKFRFFDKRTKKMMYEDSDFSAYGHEEWWDYEEKMAITALEAILNYPKHYILMQCTGLKDKNGKLIYEGDIVNGSCGAYWGKMIVEYNVAGFVLNKNGKYLNFLEGDNYIEVIGNIYENPELLKDV